MADTRYLPETLDGKISHVVEEIGEVMERAGGALQAIGKIGRHGFRSTDPHTGITYTNARAAVRQLENLLPELEDLRDAVERLLPELRDK